MGCTGSARQLVRVAGARFATWVVSERRAEHARSGPKYLRNWASLPQMWARTGPIGVSRRDGRRYDTPGPSRLRHRGAHMPPQDAHPITAASGERLSRHEPTQDVGC